MVYRWASAADTPAVKMLWTQDFESYEPYLSWYFEEAYRPERTLCDFEGAQLAAALQLRPYQLQLRGAVLPIQYYVGVITDRAFQRQGRGHALLRQTEQLLREQGCAAAFFYTDIPDYYAKLGYRHCYRLQTLTLAGTALQALAGPADRGWQALDWQQDWPVLDQVYRRMIQSYQGCIQRMEADWRYYLGELACDQGQVLHLDGQAYLLLVRQEQQLRIMELGFVGPQLIQPALAEAARLALAQGATELRWDAPDDLPALLPQFAAGDWREKPFVMARLLDWPGVLQALQYPPELCCRLDLTVAGERQAFEISKGQARTLAPLPQGASVTLSIAALTQLVLGVDAWWQEAPELTPSQRAVLQKCFPPLTTWINHYT